MTDWVLVLMLSWTNPAIGTVIVSSESACHQMGEQFVKKNPTSTFGYYMCLERKEGVTRNDR